MPAYYNEFDPRAAAWLRELIAEGLIADGDVDERSITEVRADDLAGYVQCHFFAGIGGWSLALRLAGWPDDRPVWTGSCPCPPFSCAGKKKACPECEGRDLIPHPLATGVFVCCGCGHEWVADERHLWPDFYRLIRECRPAVVFGEQVGGPDGLVWLAGVRATLEAVGYGVGAADLCAAGVTAPHIRQRLYWVGESDRAGSQPGRAATTPAGYWNTALTAGCCTCWLAVQPSAGQQGGVDQSAGLRECAAIERSGVDADGLVNPERPGGRADVPGRGPEGRTAVGRGMPWDDYAIAFRRDPKRGIVACRIPAEPLFFPLADGFSGSRVGLLRGAGNAIVPQVAAEFIGAYCEARAD